MVTRARYLMGTICELTLPVPDASAADSAFAEISRIEALISTWRSDSELVRINRAPVGEPLEISQESGDLLAHAFDVAEETGGAFNPLVGPLLELWRIREEGSVPSPAALAEALPRTQLSAVRIDEAHTRITRLVDARIEEGAFGKGYALDRALALLRSRGVAAATMNFGGQIATFGSPIDASVSDPRQREAIVVRFTMHDTSLSTSSGSEKHFAIGGREFTHIIDPRTGEAIPPRGSVSVLDVSATDADILSTALFVLGPAEGFEWAERHDVAAMFITGRERLQICMTSTFRRAADDVRILDRTAVLDSGACSAERR